ncbi:MAG: histidine phosphatase family protein [Anaerolineales bacterium]|nr:histidine phosphatase family protein [Anaerolineales bacterium]
MTLMYLIRHGHNQYVEKGKLAGRSPGVHLDARGQAQAEKLAELLSGAKLKAVYASPLERTMETAAPIAEAAGREVIEVDDLLEMDYGSWQGRSLKALRRRKLWSTVQRAPSLARFPGGESFPEAQARIIAGLERLQRKHPQKTAAIACVFHSDPIKLAIAHYIGLPLDLFQRLVVEPASINLLVVTSGQARLLRLNDTRATCVDPSG